MQLFIMTEWNLYFSGLRLGTFFLPSGNFNFSIRKVEQDMNRSKDNSRNSAGYLLWGHWVRTDSKEYFPLYE